MQIAHYNFCHTAVAYSKVHFECTWYWVTHAYLPDFLALQSLHQFLYPLLKSFIKVVRISKYLIGTYVFNFSHHFFMLCISKYIYQEAAFLIKFLFRSWFYDQKSLQNLMFTFSGHLFFSTHTNYWHFPSSMIG